MKCGSLLTNIPSFLIVNGSQPRACARADRATTLRAPALIDADRSGIGLFSG